MTTWRELVTLRYPARSFAAGASPESLARAESALGVQLPDDLRALLSETDGIEGEYGFGLGLIWTAARIASENLAFRAQPDFRALYMPFEPLLFFGDAGNGDQFAFTILEGVIRRPDVFAWNHEDDSRTWVAPDLRRYLEWWADGRIKL